MSYTIDGGSEASCNAARYVRTKYSIPFDQIISPKFEEEFNCILDFSGADLDPFLVPNWIQFETEEEMTLFLLRFA